MLPNWLYGKSKSKLASILGGGGTPADYNQVKAQVTQNAEDIESLTSFNSTNYMVTRNSVEVDLTDVTNLNLLGRAIISAINTFVENLNSNQMCEINNISCLGWWRYFHPVRNDTYTNGDTFSADTLYFLGNSNAGTEMITWYLDNVSRIIKNVTDGSGAVTSSNITTDALTTYGITRVVIRFTVYTTLQ